MYKIKETYKVNKEKFTNIFVMSEESFISHFKTLTSKWIFCDDIYTITRKETKIFIVFRCELQNTHIIEYFYFKKEDLRRLNLI